MLRRIGLILMVMLATVSLAAAQGTWTVSIFDQMAGAVTRISPTGEVAGEITLPMPEGFDFLNYTVATSPTGNEIAYIVSQAGDGTNPVQPSQLVIYDVTAQSIKGAYDLDAQVTRESINAAGTSLRFSADGTHLLTGYYVPTGEITSRVELAVLDVATGELVNTIGTNELAAAGANADSAYFTEVIAFQGDVATLLMRPVFAIEELPPVAVNWNVMTNEVTPAPQELVYATDYLPTTNEAVLLTYDANIDSLAEGEFMGEAMAVPANTVQLFDLNSGTAQTIYTDTDTNLLDAMFVQNGERLLIFAGSGIQGDLIERDGAPLQEFPNLPGSTFTQPTSDGFVYVDPMQPGALTEIVTRGDDFTPSVFYTIETPFNTLSVIPG
jgi:hypothetical protein